MNHSEFWALQHSVCQLKERFDHMAQPFCTQHGITVLQLRVLATLRYKGAQTVNQLARYNAIAGANASALCKKLACAQLVSRRRSAHDARQVSIALTEKGARLVQAFEDFCDTTIHHCLPHLQHEEFSHTLRQLRFLLEPAAEESRNQKETRYER